MTMAERQNPKLIDTQRRMRISKGAGIQPNVITQLIKQFETMKPLMQAMTSGGLGDRMRMMQQMRDSGMLSDPSGRGMKVKKGTGKRLSAAERDKLKKERDKMARRMKRKGS
jgi:signal recognition particle subunit SRP54